MHAVIDNYSRKILAWTVSDTMSPSSTYRVLVDAARQLPSVATTVIMDSGSGNVNDTVDPLFDGQKMKRILALVDVTYSNSVIEAWWRSLRHQWLYLHHLDNIATIRRLTAFYVHQHNTVMPHSARRRRRCTSPVASEYRTSYPPGGRRRVEGGRGKQTKNV